MNKTDEIVTYTCNSQPTHSFHFSTHSKQSSFSVHKHLSLNSTITSVIIATCASFIDWPWGNEVKVLIIRFKVKVIAVLDQLLGYLFLSSFRYHRKFEVIITTKIAVNTSTCVSTMKCQIKFPLFFFCKCVS